MTNTTGMRLAGSSGAPRSNLDFYQTPEKDVERLLLNTNLVPDGGLVLEPSAGDGNISRMVKQHRPNATVFSMDIEQREFKQDYVGNFLETPFKKPVDCIITNPPFTHALEFINKGLEICNGDVIMLLKLAFLETKARRDLFDKGHLREVVVSSTRINCYSPTVKVSSTGRRQNSSTMAMGWFVFNKNYKGETILKWL